MGVWEVWLLKLRVDLYYIYSCERGESDSSENYY